LKPALFLLLLAGMGLGVLTAWVSDRQNNAMQTGHKEERKADQDQIIGLNTSIQNLNRNNQVQYERHQNELRILNDKLADLKKDIATEDLRKKIHTLQGLLDKSLAPSPKAKLEIGFYDEPRSPLRDEIYAPLDGNHVTLRISILNLTDVTART
jgi:hypothetical protein